VFTPQRTPRSTLFPYTTLFRSSDELVLRQEVDIGRVLDKVSFEQNGDPALAQALDVHHAGEVSDPAKHLGGAGDVRTVAHGLARSEEHTSELQSRGHLVCRLLL